MNPKDVNANYAGIMRLEDRMLYSASPMMVTGVSGEALDIHDIPENVLERLEGWLAELEVSDKVAAGAIPSNLATESPDEFEINADTPIYFPGLPAGETPTLSRDAQFDGQVIDSTFELVIVDKTVENHDQLLTEITDQDTRNIQIIYLDTDRDALTQLEELFETTNKWDTVHIISHGRSGAIQLGDSLVDKTWLESHSESLLRLGGTITEQGDILIYGCNVAEGDAGREFLDALALLTKANVSASEDASGDSNGSRGDWELEYANGQIEGRLLFESEAILGWDGLLDLTVQTGESGVNATTTSNQSTTSYGGGNVAMDGSGNYVIVWNDLRTNSGDIYFQRYNSAGIAQGGNVLVNSTTGSLQDEAVVAMDSDGDFVVAWTSANQDGSDRGIYAQRFNASGIAQGSEFRVNSTTSGAQDLPAIAMSDTQFVVAWTSSDGGGTGIYGQRYNNSGVAQGGEWLINTTTVGNQQYPVIGMDSDGDFVVAWEGAQDADSSFGVYAQRFNASGVAQGGEFRANTYTTNIQWNAAIDCDDSGNFVIVWESIDQDTGGNSGIYGQRYDAAGLAQGGEFRVNSTMTNEQSVPTVAMNDNGDFVVAWHSFMQDGSDYGVYAQQYSATGSALGLETLINVTTTNDQRSPSVAYEAGKVAFTWSGNGTGDSSGVFGRLYVTSLDDITVDTTNDVMDGTVTSLADLVANRGADGLISLREAIVAANNQAGLNNVYFNISGSGPHTIDVTSALPDITDTIVIDGTSEPDWSANGSRPIIVLDGNNLAASGLVLTSTADGSTIRGLVIRDFGGNGITIHSGSNGHTISGNYIGRLSTSGSDAGAAEENTGSGIWSQGTNLLIGGIAASDRNVISGNAVHGIDLNSSSNTLIFGNYVGTDSSGTIDIGNNNSGVLVSSGSNIQIGTNLDGSDDAMEGNLFSGNNDNGIQFWGNVVNSFVRGNIIGLNATGTAPLGNGTQGIQFGNGANGNTIGGITSDARNVISGNTYSGIEFFGGTTVNNLIIGNYIGTNLAGSAAVGNGTRGINLSGGSSGNTIGGSTAGHKNVVSGNTQQGIYLTDSDNNTIQGNYVGTDSAGTLDLNGTASDGSQSGIYIGNGSAANLIGGTSAGARNVISGNNWYGIEINDSTSTNNTIQGNFIGTTFTGLSALGNVTGGVGFWNAGLGNTLGGGSSGAGNVVAGNLGLQVMVGNATASATIQGNYIGLGADGSTTIGGLLDGIQVYGASTNTLIGTDGNGSYDAEERNVIAANRYGITVYDNGTSGTTIAGNYIGIDVTGLIARSNSADGIRVHSGATGTVIGGSQTTQRNVISGNLGDGIEVNGEATDGTVIRGNYIGVNAVGTAYLSNSSDGIHIEGGADNTTIGGSVANEGNWIVALNGHGINIVGDSSGTVILGNRMGTDATGTIDWGTRFAGISIDGGASNTIIGGTAVGEGNIIAFAGRDPANSHAISIGASAGTGISIQGNSIYGQRGFGIDLNSDGLTPNDTLDVDIGPNDLQNFPVITAASTNGSQIFISGTVNSIASVTGLIIHFYASQSTGNLERREGKRYFGSTTVNTNATGDAIFTNVTLASSVTAGEMITATMTTPGMNGNTSEFSQAVAATASSGNSAPQDSQVSATTDGGLVLNDDGGNDAYLVNNFAGTIFGGRTQLTLETRFSSTNLFSAGDEMNLVSYATTAQDNEIRMAVRRPLATYTLDFFVNGTVVSAAGYDASLLLDGNAHTVSVTWNNLAGDYTFFVDGVQVGAGTGLNIGYTTLGAGVLVVGNDQDAMGGMLDARQAFRGTLYDLRVFNDVRTPAEILASASVAVPFNENGLIANWQFNDLSNSGITTNSVSGDHLALAHASGASFTASNTTLTLQVSEGAAIGTAVGRVSGMDLDREARITQLLASDPDLHYSAETGKFYRMVTTSTHWDVARTNALSAMLNGVNGQLAVVRSAAENSLLATLAAAANKDMWLGGSDAASEGTWMFQSAGVDADPFWQGDSSGYRLHGAYTNWQGGEPNNNGGTGDYLVMYASGFWDDEAVDGSALANGYFIEWNADEVLDVSHPLLYSIVSQTIGGTFAIHGDNGTITLANRSGLDHESNPTHAITVRVSDGSLTYDKVYTIAVSDATVEPTIVTPGSQATMEDTDLVFSSSNGNAITITDQHAGTNTRVQVSLSVANGSLTLSQTAGLTFAAGSNGSNAIVINGTEIDINMALEGLVFTPSNGYTGSANLQIATTLAAELDGWYSFEDGTATDQSIGVSQHGVFLGNATTVNDSERGNVLQLDGTADFVQISGVFGQPASATLAAWVNLNQASINGSDVISLGDTLVLRLDQTGGDGVVGMFYDGTTWVSIASQRHVAGTGWHHVAFSFDDVNNLQSVYIDGELVAQGAHTNSISYIGGDTYIGRHGSGTSPNWDFHGRVDDARVYSRALSSSEIAAIAAETTSDSKAVSISIGTQNDAPVLDNSGTMVLDPVFEDEVANSGSSVADLIASAGGDRITDVDLGAIEGIAITGLNSGNGIWQYSNNGGLNWNDIGTVSSNSALLLRSSDFVRFSPNGQNGTTADFTFHAWDQSTGTSGTKVDVTINGNATAFSTATETATIVVIDRNDAPTITDNAQFDFTATDEDTTSTATLANAILSSVTWNDVDAIALGGLAITNTSGSGTWQYSTNGTNWTDFGLLSSANSLLVSSTTQIRYVPGGISGEVAQFVFRAWDQTSGLPSATGAPTYEDTSVTGNTTAFSTQTALAQISVISLNDEQVLSLNTGMSLAENSTGNIISETILLTSDVDHAVTQVVYTITSITQNGTLRRGGVALGINDSFTQADIRSGLISYDHNGSETSTDSFSFTVDDGVGTVTNDTFNLVITLINDNAPTIQSDGGGATANINMAENALIVTTASAVDSDSPNPSLTYSISGGADSGLFTMDATTGVLSFVGGRDRENPSDSDLDGVYLVTIQVSDGSLTDSQAISITITDVDEYDVSVPVDANSSSNSLAEDTVVGSTVGITVNAIDADATHNIVTYMLDNSAGGLFAIDSTSGIVMLVGILDYEATTSHTITVRATSADGSATSHSFLIHVTNVMEGGVGVISDSNGNANALFENANIGATVGITANASDPNIANSVSYSLDDDGGGRFAIDSITGVVTVVGNLDFETNFAHAITIRATSTDGSYTTQVFSIGVMDTNETPIALADVYHLAEGQAYSVGGSGVLGNDSDPDSDSLVAMLVASPMHGSLTLNANGSFVYVHDGSESHIDQFTYQVSDGRGEISIALVQLVIAPINDAPQGTSDHWQVTLGFNLVKSSPGVLLNDVDVDSTNLLAVLNSLPQHGSISLSADGGFTYVASPGYLGTDSFTYRATDGFDWSEPINVTFSTQGFAFVGSSDSDFDQEDEDTDDEDSDSDEQSDLVSNLLTLETGTDRISSIGERTQAQEDSELLESKAERKSRGLGRIGGNPEGELGEVFLGRSFRRFLSSRLVGDRPDLSVLESEDLDGANPLLRPAELARIDYSWLGEQVRLASENLSELPGLERIAAVFLGAATSLSVGYIAWTVRGAYLFGGLVASAPAWQRVDPLAILDFAAAQAHGASPRPIRSVATRRNRA